MLRPPHRRVFLYPGELSERVGTIQTGGHMTETIEQQQLFIESREEAVTALAQRIGGKKKLASLMFPTEPVDEAHKKLLAKISPTDRAVLSADDWDLVVRVGRENDCHICKWWADDRTGYQRANPSEPRDSDDELAERIESATVVLAKALDIYARRQGVNEIKAVK